MTDHEFLSWLYDRLVFVYGESPNLDFVQRLRRIVDAVPSMEGGGDVLPERHIWGAAGMEGDG